MMAGDVTVGGVVELISGTTHRLVEDIDVLLGTVDGVDVKVEILLLVDDESLISIGEDLWIVDIGVLGVIADRDVTDGSDLDGIAGLEDVALVVAIDNAGLAVNK